MKTYKELVEILGKNGVAREENNIPFMYKQSPDGEAGYLDKRESMVGHAKKEDMDQNPQNYPSDMIKNYTHLFPEITEADRYEFGGIPIGVLRKQMGWYSTDLTTTVITKEQRIPGAMPIPVRIYQTEGKKTGRPCLIFFHGGGFVAGSMDVVENPCKAIAEKADAVVISVDYRLAPEHPFPEGMEDCYGVVKWAWEHFAELGIDPQKIGVAGDSAGGNLAAVCAMRDRDEAGGRIHYQALLYATLMRGEGEEYPGYYWSPDIYDNKAEDPYIQGAGTWIKNSSDMLQIAYVQKQDRKNPYISPLDAAGFESLPKTLIATAEYDFLRAECDLYGKRLSDAGVSVRNIRYGGVTHAFLDKYGFYPQAEDCVNEIAADLTSL